MNQNSSTNIAVIGGGIFGVTTALHLSSQGYKVDLFEKEKDIFQAATGINQYRLHRGYHYPRSSETISSSLISGPSFMEWYGKAVNASSKHHYAIARDGSKVNASQYEAVLKRFGLPFEKVSLPLVESDTVESLYQVDESLIDMSLLKTIVLEKLTQSSVRVFLSQEVSVDALRSEYDFIIVSAYAQMNRALGKNLPHPQYQFEVCEKPVLELSQDFKGISVVVMDGPFTCIDPLGATNLHVMGNVVHAIHAVNTGEYPEIPNSIRKMLNSGIVENPSVTNFHKFMETASYFMPQTKGAKHVGSMFTVRTVLPRVDSTDTRPTLVRKLDDQVISIFSGKLSNCVKAAHDTLALIQGD